MGMDVRTNYSSNCNWDYSGYCFVLSDGIVDIVSMIFTLMVVWIGISVSVGRLRDRGYTEIVEFALRLILFPWGLVECAFLAGQE